MIRVPDLDHLRSSIFASFALFSGFLMWIYFNPPGHSGWYYMAGPFAMAVAGTQQMKASILARPIGLASLLCLCAYVFIMPQLSTFVGLGLLIFVAMFVVCYFFTGIARLCGMIGIINNIAVQNNQTYDFAAMANSLIFTLLSFAFAFAS